MNWAEYNDSVGAASQIAKVQQRFGDVATCYAGMGQIRALHGGVPIDNPDRYNACKFTENGQVTLSVLPYRRADSEWLKFEVKIQPLA